MDNNEKEKNIVSAPENTSADKTKTTAKKTSTVKATANKSTAAKTTANKSTAAKTTKKTSSAAKATPSKSATAKTGASKTAAKASPSKSATVKPATKKTAPKSVENVDASTEQSVSDADAAKVDVAPAVENAAVPEKKANSSSASKSKSATAKKATAAKKSTTAQKPKTAAKEKTAVAADASAEENKAESVVEPNKTSSAEAVNAEVASVGDVPENVNADEKSEAENAEKPVLSDEKVEVDSSVNADENTDNTVNAAEKVESEQADIANADAVSTDDASVNVSADESADAEKEGEAKPKSKFMRALCKVGGVFAVAGKTVGRWFKRMFLGASKELTDEEKFKVEELQSPTKQVVKKFFRKPLAVISLVLLVGMFLFVFIGSAVHPLDLSYTEAFQQNLSPGYGMMTVPKKMRNNVKDISSFSNFSVGLSEDGHVYTWGKTKLINSVSDVDIEKLPSEISGGNVAYVAAGLDHAVAITNDGKVVCWGEHSNAQYGKEHNLTDSMVMLQPNNLIDGTINVDNVQQLTCGYQVTAIVMKSGSVYCWGNFASGATNMKQLSRLKNVQKVAFLGSRVAALLKDGTVWMGNAKDAFDSYEVDDGNGGTKFISLFDEYLADRKVVDLVATYGSIGILTEDGELIVAGSLSDDVAMPSLSADEKILKISAGAKHYTILTSAGRVYSFGSSVLGQCDAYKKKVSTDSEIFACAFQNYLTLNGKVTETWGLKGYLFGTDSFGRDIFARIINGGRITMTIGAVSVIISTIIAVIVGVLSGYFGGKVDMFLMRVTEVFGAIPFLPFALILSAVLAGSAVSELTRMFIIMVILGILSWTGLARMIRGQVLAEREKEFVTAAKAMGVKEHKIAFKHILPNIISVILVSVTLDFAGCMLTEASLSYLGFGVRLPKPTWGNMLNGANNAVVIRHYWWQWLFPSLFLLVTTIAINLIGDALRDVMDPKSSSER